MPASPVMNTTWPRPALTSLKRSRSSPNSRSRPTRVRPTATSKRMRRPRGRSTSKAWTGVCLHRHLAQIEGLEEATDRPVRRLTHQHAARAGHLLERAARFVVSPTAV